MKVGGFLSLSTPSAKSCTLGAFELRWTAPRFEVLWKNKVVWKTPNQGAFLKAFENELEAKESRGFFRMKERLSARWVDCNILSLEAAGDGVVLQGELLGDTVLSWSLRFTLVDGEQLAFHVSFLEDGQRQPTCVIMNWQMDKNERVFGLGTQFTHLDLKGKKVPILSQEPGIGRGVQPITWMMETFFGAGGTTVNSNAPSTHLLTSGLKSLALENKEYAVYDFRSAEMMSLQIYATEVKGRLFFGETPLDCLEVSSRLIGRMPPLPSWLQQGAVIGMQGGRALVEQRLEQLKAHQASVAAFWLQDWVGARKTAAGHQLWWNWEPDEDTYPEWGAFVRRLKSAGIRVMAYVNPFLVNVASQKNVKRNYYQEALEHGYLIKNQKGAPYAIMNTSFSAGLLDLSNPKARQFVKDIIKEEMLSTEVSGWMADFGEALPFDAVLHGDVEASEYHNAYPEVWAQVNREVIAEAGLEGDVAFFMRSGFTQSPASATLFWLGDQLTGWRAEDGIKNAVTGLLSSGMSGFALNHSDIGGYTATTLPHVPFPLSAVGHCRSRELLWRWIELNAFTAVFRTHEGNQPAKNYQIFDDEQTLAHFARFSRVYAAFSHYRKSLCEEAAQKGWPLVRHPWLHYPDNDTLRGLEYQMMLGPDVMVAPVLEPNQRSQRVYLPPDHWTHLWSGDVFKPGGDGEWVTVDAPLGTPPVFLRSHGRSTCQILEKLSENKCLGG